MANVVITSTTNSIKVEFNDYSSSLDGQEGGVYQKSLVTFYRYSTKVIALVSGEKEWPVAYTATANCFIIDSIDGAAPSSNLDLYNKLAALIA